LKKDLAQYLAEPGKKVSLKKLATSYPGEGEKEQGEIHLEEVKKRLSLLQETMYASRSHTVLVIFQAMDAAGKDSAIDHVFSGINPQGCEVHSFKQPSEEEYAHDFLWRHYKALPVKGKIGVHNRSHYENVLVCKVHPEYILAENIPAYRDVKSIDKAFWKKRYESIRNFESHLSENGVVIIKFFLHVSKDEQKQRFLDRINDPEKNWKFAAGDLAEREHWDSYMDAYETAIEETASDKAPWYIIPADKKWYARLAIARIIEDTMEGLNLKFPELPEEEVQELEAIKKKLAKDN
jgi:PPK2 family polyphosphate:nucleotide phosphotransferase